MARPPLYTLPDYARAKGISRHTLSSRKGKSGHPLPEPHAKLFKLGRLANYYTMESLDAWFNSFEDKRKK